MRLCVCMRGCVWGGSASTLTHRASVCVCLCVSVGLRACCAYVRSPLDVRQGNRDWEGRGWGHPAEHSGGLKRSLVAQW